MIIVHNPSDAQDQKRLWASTLIKQRTQTILWRRWRHLKNALLLAGRRVTIIVIYNISRRARPFRKRFYCGRNNNNVNRRFTYVLYACQHCTCYVPAWFTRSDWTSFSCWAPPKKLAFFIYFVFLQIAVRARLFALSVCLSRFGPLRRFSRPFQLGALIRKKPVSEGSLRKHFARENVIVCDLRW